MCEHGEHHRHEDCGCEGGGQGDCGREERPAPRHGHGDCGCETEGHAHERGGCGCGERHAPHHGRQQAGGCRCACHEGPGEEHPPFRRRFSTRAERIALLEQYLQDLRAEAQAVEERIAEMKAQS
jgi:hypothetical protein